MSNDEAQKQAAGLAGGHAEDFAFGKCHCADCGCDFDMMEGKLDDESHYTCPQCGAYLEKAAAEKENDATNKQAQGSRQTAAAPLCCAGLCRRCWATLSLKLSCGHRVESMRSLPRVMDGLAR